MAMKNMCVFSTSTCTLLECRLFGCHTTMPHMLGKVNSLDLMWRWYNQDTRLRRQLTEVTGTQICKKTLPFLAKSSLLCGCLNHNIFAINLNLTGDKFTYIYFCPLLGSVTGDRLYAIGRKSATVGQCFEYELRGGGIDPVEYWIAHQYLAIAQETGAWKFSQVFFTGSDYFDKISGKQNTPANAWLAYTDLTNYLTGQNISNWEIRIPFSINNYDPVTQTLTKKWTVSTEYAGLSSIRLDFSDIWGYWRGKVTVRVGEQSSFSVRLGQDPLDPTYNAVTVPLADKNITSGMTLQIDLEKEKDSAWPSIIQLVGAKYEPLYLANPLYEEISSASVSVFTSWNHADVVPTHKQFAAGKLTDGKINPDFWYWNSTVGWYQIPEGRFNIMIDLGSARQGISQVKLYSHREPRNIVYLATKLTALISSQCQPQSGGTLGLSCLPEASSVEVKTDKIGNGDGYLLTLPFNNVTARYVSVSGVPQGWFLLDEVEIVGNLGTVLSRGRP